MICDCVRGQTWKRTASSSSENDMRGPSPALHGVAALLSASAAPSCRCPEAALHRVKGTLCVKTVNVCVCACGMWTDMRLMDKEEKGGGCAVSRRFQDVVSLPFPLLPVFCLFAFCVFCSTCCVAGVSVASLFCSRARSAISHTTGARAGGGTRRVCALENKLRKWSLWRPCF